MNIFVVCFKIVLLFFDFKFMFFLKVTTFYLRRLKKKKNDVLRLCKYYIVCPVSACCIFEKEPGNHNVL